MVKEIRAQHSGAAENVSLATGMKINSSPKHDGSNRTDTEINVHKKEREMHIKRQLGAIGIQTEPQYTTEKIKQYFHPCSIKSHVI